MKNILACIICLVVGVLIGWLSYTTIWGHDTVEAEVPGQIVTDTLYADTSFIPTLPGLTPTTQLRDIRVSTREWYATIYIKVHGKKTPIQLRCRTTYRGVYYFSSVETMPLRVTIELVEKNDPAVRLVAISEIMYYPMHRDGYVSMEMGIMFKNRLSVVCGAQLWVPVLELRPYVGLRYVWK